MVCPGAVGRHFFCQHFGSIAIVDCSAAVVWSPWKWFAISGHSSVERSLCTRSLQVEEKEEGKLRRVRESSQLWRSLALPFAFAAFPSAQNCSLHFFRLHRGSAAEQVAYFVLCSRPATSSRRTFRFSSWTCCCPQLSSSPRCLFWPRIYTHTRIIFPMPKSSQRCSVAHHLPFTSFFPSGISDRAVVLSVSVFTWMSLGRPLGDTIVGDHTNLEERSQHCSWPHFFPDATIDLSVRFYFVTCHYYQHPHLYFHQLISAIYNSSIFSSESVPSFSRQVFFNFLNRVNTELHCHLHSVYNLNSHHQVRISISITP